MSLREVSWEKLFAYDLPTPKVESSRKCACGGKNCKKAKHLVCRCRCHSEFHGAANRDGMPKLDNLLGLNGLKIDFPVEPPSPEELAIW